MVTALKSRFQHTDVNKKPKLIVTLAALSAILVIAQVSLAFLPNIELVSLLIVIYTLTLGWYAALPVAVFVMVEGLIYGFGPWWINYLYIWPILYYTVIILRNQRQAFFWAIVLAMFGLLFGTLCSIPYLIMGGIPSALAYIASGLVFDAVHCAGNFVICIALFNPLLKFAGRYLSSLID